MTSIQPAREGRHILIYADGSCHGNPGPGGYAAVLRRMDGADQIRKLRVRGYETGETTNVRMEMTAAARALEAVKPGEPEPIVIYCDSSLVVNGMNGWVERWSAKGWKGSDGKSIANRDLWERLTAAAESKSVEWRWVKSHAGHPYNGEVDKLARAQMEEARAAFYGFTADDGR